MFRYLTLSAALAAPALLVAGCNLGEIPIGSNQDDISCDSSSDCPGGEICVAQVCESCQPAGEVCDGLDNDCDGVVDDATPGTTLCPMGGTCVNGACQWNQPGCMVDSDCADPTQACVNGVCQVSQPGCVADADCAPGEVCVGGACQQSNPQVCMNDAQCDAGEVCVNGVCQQSNPQVCMSDADCPDPTQSCVNGVCQAGMCSPEVCDGIDNDCDGAVDDAVPGAVLCPMGGACINGMCVVNQPICMVDSDCNPSQLCVNGVCQQSNPQPCMVDAQCAPGELCVNGVCQSGMCNPTPEVCDGFDNDCDGVIDEPIPGAVLCPMGGTCVNGACQQACMVDSDCPDPTQSCVNGACQSGPQACMADSDCNPMQVCVNGVCSP